MTACIALLLLTAQPLAAVDTRDDTGRTPLILASIEDRPDEVKRLIEGGAEVDAVDDHGFTALLYAAQYSLPSVRLLLAAGADVSYRDELGTSALSIAREARRDDTVELLRAHGATESLEERLDAALRRGERDEMERLIEAGADVDALDNGSYQTPLMTAIEARDMEAVLILLSAGADPTREGTGIETTNESAVTFAARQGSTWAARQLLEHDGVRRAGRETLERALFAGCRHPDVLALLLDKGASPDARGAGGRTPLMCAAEAGAESAVLTLLEAGADASARTDEGDTAADLAEKAGKRDLAARIRRAR